MNNWKRRLAVAGTGLAWTLMSCISAQAEDIEIFVGNSQSTTTNPNILLILDDSGSMGADVLTQNNYDPNVNYSGSCEDDRVYWTTNSSPPSFGTDRWFYMSSLVCQRARDAFAAQQGGTYLDIMAQYDPGSQDRWETIASSQKSRVVECQDDLPDSSIGWAGHGDGSSTTAVYPRNGNQNQRWTTDPNHASRITWGQWPSHQFYRIYSGNYLNWYYGSATVSTRIEVMQDVATNLVNSINGVN
ncbi:MAG: hypothetical protein R3305_06120, partial [Gammaproteobacteria bacterium]|nr:hypothetical protein [Gammaproteobacteria bacterium]